MLEYLSFFSNVKVEHDVPSILNRRGQVDRRYTTQWRDPQIKHYLFLEDVACRKKHGWIDNNMVDLPNDIEGRKIVAAREIIMPGDWLMIFLAADLTEWFHTSHDGYQRLYHLAKLSNYNLV